MISQRKTTVAVLRQELGLSVEEFAQLLGKSVSTVTKFDNGQLKLGEETAFKISKETGVATHWLLAEKPTEKPYFFDCDGYKRPYHKEIFELVQAHKGKPTYFFLDPALHFVNSTMVANDWHSVYAAAAHAGRDQLAVYLMRKFLNTLVDRLGKDDEAFLRLNADARIVAANGTEYKWTRAKNLELEGAGGVLLQKVRGTPKRTSETKS
jgi:transcriptional regulator with XRE-family HTH domain